jgi:hypothetical protein
MSDLEIAIDQIVKAGHEGDEDLVRRLTTAFASHNWPFMYAISRLAHVDFASGDYQAAAWPLVKYRESKISVTNFRESE